MERKNVFRMTFESSLTELCELNSSFDTGVLRICYTGKNRNGSFISKETIEKSIPTIYNCPIVCNYDRETDTLGAHDMEVVRDNDGAYRLVNLTTPVGVIPESARVWFQNYEETDGTVNEYLYAEVLLWKRQEAYRKIKKDGITAHSMEITVKDGKTVDGMYQINDFEFTAFDLIGVEPCFESSSLEVFSQNQFKQQMAEMMSELKETLTMVNSRKLDNSNELGDKNKYGNYSMKGGNMLLDEKLNLAAQYGIDVNTLDFSIEELSIEELKAKFEEIKNANAEPDDKFSLTNNIVDEIDRELSVEKITTDWGECGRYCYVDCDLELNEVYCWDLNDWLLYGFKFSINGDSITIDFDSKKRKKFSIVDFDGVDQASPVESQFKLLESKLKEFADKNSVLEDKFNKASATISSMEAELSALREFKSDTESAIAKEKRDAIFEQFSDLAGVEAYDNLRSNCENYDLDELEDKCYAIRGRIATSQKFSLTGKEPAPRIRVSKPENSDEPYGGIFLKFPSK